MKDALAKSEPNWQIVTHVFLEKQKKSLWMPSPPCNGIKQFFLSFMK